MFYKIVMKALGKCGYEGVSSVEVNKNIKYYLTQAADVDVYS
jgi:phosphoribosylformylglycinamidine (FGAM) synthase PurS component